MSNRGVALARRPVGLPVQEDFEIVKVELPALEAEEVRVRIQFASVDPGQRGLMNGKSTYQAGMELGAVVRGRAIGVVEASRSTSIQVGATVFCRGGWAEAVVVPADEVAILDPLRRPAAEYLSAFGHPGLTAWLGIGRAAEVQEGDTVFISSAAGGVGLIAGQLAKARGARVIGTVGTTMKAEMIVDEFGFDAAVNYRTDDVASALKNLAPEGLDVYFDNVGREQLDIALEHMRVGGRIAMCGRISDYDDGEYRWRNVENILKNRLRVTGFNVYDHLHEFDTFRSEMVSLLESGTVRDLHRIEHGVEAIIPAFVNLFGHPAPGKALVQMA